ncbi:uncharacterized protein AC631_02109 [Debaryomyces fabryi]|uniref:Cell division control protein 14 n=1 Tax=Debaryomyces fabryi TaxID=58627 RepID=A0A0V1Q0U2_9ASCO|nr:uncharacterized protein AC631_02109 [Debaryomyces fabryi]KSA02113.1 hypothetical protein AC631_02109 [Debaryomyces fabryi]CUM55310.1 unnamed protein product [Debaryomyces fabryi]
MEDIILDIIDHLDSRHIDDLIQGIENLDKVLSLLLPYITSSRKNPQAPRNDKLVSFVNLQDNFQYNITSHLIQFYKVVWEDIAGVDMDIILTCNRLLQGLLLLHPESRKIFNRLNNMKTMLNFVRITNGGDGERHIPVEVTISFISTLIHILLKDLTNFRVFEESDGCSVVIRKLQLSSFPPHKGSQPSKQQELNFKVIEFLIFYLIDENEIASSAKKRTTQEKSDLFRPDFPEIDSLVESLNDLKNI